MEPLIVEIDVETTPDHAFDVWTAQLGRWWPPSHTLSGTKDLVIEPFPGGRIYETASDGTEHDWGEVVSWEPPARVRCLWHLFFERSEATDLEVTFAETASGTRVVIRQTGFERLGGAGVERRTRTLGAWSTIAARFREVIGDPTTPERVLG